MRTNGIKGVYMHDDTTNEDNQGFIPIDENESSNATGDDELHTPVSENEIDPDIQAQTDDVRLDATEDDDLDDELEEDEEEFPHP